MPYATDEKLKSYLDTNQLAREQMCLAILALDPRFTEVRPRHPRGGPDGGRDIEATFRGTHRTFGAVGFINQADDSQEKKRRAKEKFLEDLDSALAAKPKPEVFVFMTNINFTVSEKGDLVSKAIAMGLSVCEVFDRERIRIALDNTDGLAIRYQYLQISLSEAEQAAFFSRWGSEIQSVISTGFQEVHRTLNRLVFLLESTEPLTLLSVTFELDRIYSSYEIAHFRTFCELELIEPKHGILAILFGQSNGSDRIQTDLTNQNQIEHGGIASGISGGQWECMLPLTSANDSDETESDRANTNVEYVMNFTRDSWFRSVGIKEAGFMSINYNKSSIIRLGPILTLRDLNECSFLFRMNRGFAEKVSKIHVYANEYKLLEIPKAEWILDYLLKAIQIPVYFSNDELSDPWVYIRPKLSTMFTLSFSEQTPHRFVSPQETKSSVRGQIK